LPPRRGAGASGPGSRVAVSPVPGTPPHLLH
jgi:hypothetical protein